MADHYQVAIIGSGPGGLSAAITAAEQGLSHVLLERTNHLSDTIFKYQKGKKVMAHPMRLPLQGSMPFEEGFREGILENWSVAAEKSGANIRLNAEVRKMSGERGTPRTSASEGNTSLKRCGLIVGMKREPPTTRPSSIARI